MLLLAAGPAAIAGEVPPCAWGRPARIEPHTIVDVDKVWSGARVDFAGVASGTAYIAGYYDQERRLTIASIDTGTRIVRRQTLPDRFSGWDSHNAVALAVDKAGRLHVAANMHASPLNYFRNDAPGQPLVRANMTLPSEARVTYPRFVNTPDGELLFVYRAGGSGDGVWKAKRWDGQRWSNVGSGPFLGDRGLGGKVSAYPSRIAPAADGTVHLAIVWRLTPDAATNVRLSYAKTKDFLAWHDSHGRRLTLPLSPETAETVLHTGPNAGLLNNARIALDTQGRPIITFTRHDAAGRNTVELAVARDDGWHIQLMNTSNDRIDVKGKGSLPNTVALSEVDFSQADRPALYHRFPGAPGVREVLDPATLAPICVEKPETDGLSRLADRPLPSARPQTLPIGPKATLVWAAQPANQDRPHPCTEAAPLACRPPPSTLKLVITGERTGRP